MISVLDFANVISAAERQFVEPEATVKKYAVVSFWKINVQSLEYNCYRTFKVDNPAILMLGKRNKNMVAQRFLHRTGDELFYFTK